MSSFSGHLIFFALNSDVKVVKNILLVLSFNSYDLVKKSSILLEDFALLWFEYFVLLLGIQI